jgi:hypothetical protein
MLAHALNIVTPMAVFPAMFVVPDFDRLFGDDNAAFIAQHGETLLSQACAHP